MTLYRGEVRVGGTAYKRDLIVCCSCLTPRMQLTQDIHWGEVIRAEDVEAIPPSTEKFVNGDTFICQECGAISFMVQRKKGEG